MLNGCKTARLGHRLGARASLRAGKISSQEYGQIAEKRARQRRAAHAQTDTGAPGSRLDGAELRRLRR